MSRKRVKPLYWLRSGTDCLADAKPYGTIRSAVDAYARTARELARFGQRYEATIHVARSVGELREYPDWVLSLEPHGGVRREPA